MARIATYRDLDVWQQAMDLVVAVYRLTEDLPDSEKYGLRSQAQLSVVSALSNIAEGFGRGSRLEYARFIAISRGSLMELETQLTLMVRLNLVDREDVVPLWDQTQAIGKMLTALRNSLAKARPSPSPQSLVPSPSTLKPAL